MHSDFLKQEKKKGKKRCCILMENPISILCMPDVPRTGPFRNYNGVLLLAW